jgi:hypothetical protein
MFSVVVLAAAFVAFPASSGAQAPSGDSVVGSGTAADPSILANFDLDAHSGPSGENPTGTASFAAVGFPDLRVAGRVTCLSVAGNRAVVGIDNSLGNSAFGPSVFFDVTDGTTDLLGVVFSSGPPATVCPVPGIQPSPNHVLSGNIVVTDAEPFPASKDQCKNGGWQTYDVFKNQGDCVSWVATHGNNPPTNRTG